MPKRIVVNMTAYLFASLFAGLVIAVTSTQWLLAPSRADLNLQIVTLIIQLALFYGSLTFAFSAIPAGVAIYLAERNKIWRPVWYALAGAIIGCLGALFHLTVLLAGGDETITNTLTNPLFLRLSIFELITLPGSGVGAALLFWLIAICSRRPAAIGSREPTGLK